MCEQWLMFHLCHLLLCLYVLLHVIVVCQLCIKWEMINIHSFIHIIAKPTLANLIVIRWRSDSGDVKKFRLKGSIVHKWKNIGNLVVPRQELEVWGRRMNDSECCDAMLSYWMDHPPRHYPATWEGLYELLDDSELGQVAIELEQAVKNCI